MKAIYICLIAVMIISCSELADDIPECIEGVIDVEEEAGCADGMDEYLFNDRLVYIFTQKDDTCSDFGSLVYDGQCAQLCFIGGIGGLTECEGVNFKQSAIFQRTVWSK